MNDSSSHKKFHNLDIYCTGYLKRARVVTLKKGPPFLACAIKALTGPTDNVDYCYFDCKVVGFKAKELIEQYMPSIQQDREVLAEVKLGDLWTDYFVHEVGPKEGQEALGLKTRLLWIKRLTVDGTVVYSSRSESDGPPTIGEEATPDSAVADSSVMASATGTGGEGIPSTTH